MAIGLNLFSQNLDFASLMNSHNFNDTQQAFTNYWAGKDTKQKGKGWKAYKRWENFMRFRVDATGKIPNSAITYEEWKKYNSSGNNIGGKLNSQNQQMVNNWSYVGPNNGVPTGGGAGRLTCIKFDPNNSNVIYVGAPAGGLWKSTNGGASWITYTDELASIGVSDVAIDPTNSNILYLGTGDRDGGDTYSVGILKSTDGGVTWASTGMTHQLIANNCVNRILIDPTNPSVLYAATAVGIFKSSDGAATWASVLGGNYKDMLFQPGNSNTIYASGGTFSKSINGGLTWSSGSGLTIGGAMRVAIAVTPADPNYVYLIAGAGPTAGYGLIGVYKSTDAGATFTQTQGTSPNLLGWESDGSDNGGQSWYDLVIQASPTNKNVVIVGGVNTWRSTNGGSTFNIYTHWYGGGAPYVHADVHAIEFLPGSGTNVFIGCDGGIFKTTNGTTWTDLSANGLHIAQMYKLGVSQTNSNLTLTGWQDNGTSLHNGANANGVLGGDGMEAAINNLNSNYMYGELYYGAISRSTNGGASFNNIVGSGGSGVNEDGAWVTPYVLDPTTPSIMYVGKNNVYKSTNNGNTFTALGLNGASLLDVVAVAPSNGSYIYAAKASSLFVCSNGFNFSAKSAPAGPITSIAIDNLNPLRIWVSVSGYLVGQKVFYSNDGGTTWTNVSNGLPNVPCNTIVYRNNSNDEIYVGTDIGVFYKDATMTNWVNYSSGLPNVVVDEIEIQYSSSKLRAATYGRGLWEVALVTPPTTAPTANFAVNSPYVCVGKDLYFQDLSTNGATNWEWTFTGGTPSTSNDIYPNVFYNTPGVYPVKLKVSNSMGADSLEVVSMVNVYGPPAISAGADIIKCKFDTAFFSLTGGVSYVWTPSSQIKYTNSGQPYYANNLATINFSVTGTDAHGCIGTDAISVKTILPPATPTISQNVDTLTCSANNVFYQWYLGGSPLPGETNKKLTIPSQTGPYTVTVTDTFNCGFSATSANFNPIGINTYSELDALTSIYPNPSIGNFTILIANQNQTNYQLQVVDVLGKVCYTENFAKSNSMFKKDINLNLKNGTYTLILTDLNSKQKAVKKISVLSH